MQQEMTNIEKLLDENNNENLVLFDNTNKAVEFEQIAVIPLNERIYAILLPVDKIPYVNEDEALVFSIEEIDDEDCLVIVDDLQTVNEVFEIYYDLLEESVTDGDEQN